LARSLTRFAGVLAQPHRVGVRLFAGVRRLVSANLRVLHRGHQYKAGRSCWRYPTAQWTAQQIPEATPFGVGPELIIRDNDGKFGADFDRAAKGAGIRVLRTAVQAPLMNSVCERFLGSVRRDCLDHIVILGERHLKHLLKEYCFNYFNMARPHQGIRQRLPTEPRSARPLIPQS
jgi:putative transposase